MRYFHAATIALLLQLPALVSCQKVPKDRLQGRWVGESVENFASSQIARATGWAQGTSFEFRGNRVTVAVPAETPREGTFVVSEQPQSGLRVSFVRPQGTRDEVELQLVGPERLRWRFDDGRTIVMRKVQD
jgi:hypothetical protein